MNSQHNPRPLPRFLRSLLALAPVLMPTPAGGAAIIESARQIPVIHDVDVVIAGGSVGAVSAAVEAAAQGAKVFLAAPRPYLGDDVAGPLRLWLDQDEQPDTPLERKIFDQIPAPDSFRNRLAFTYQADQPAAKNHPDPDTVILSDGKWTDAASQSVQYDADVTIIADLGKVTRVKELHLLGYRRDGDFAIGEVLVWTSPDGELWREMGRLTETSVGGSGDPQVQLSIEVKQPSRHVKLLVKRTPDAKRLLLGELLVIEDALDVAATPGKRQPPTPMQVKIALDQALIDAKVPFLYGSPATDLLRGADGKPAGIVITNRAGRQAIRAKLVIDATPRATLARAAGVTFAPFPVGSHSFQRVVIGGSPHPADGVEVRQLDFTFTAHDGTQPVFLYSLDIPMKDASPASFAAAENTARERTFDIALADEADALFLLPPDPMNAAKDLPGDSFDPATLDLAALQPAGEERLFILGGCAGLSRKAAAKLVRPLAQMRIGRRVGATAAAQAAKLPAPDSPRVAATAAAKATQAGEVREILTGSRPTDRNRPTIPSPERPLPVLGTYDVVVVGGGTGGAPAAIGAARQGAKTLVIEYQDHLGGVGTLGLISSYYHGYREGFTAEVDKAIAEMGGPQRKGGWNPVAKREWWRREITKAGGEIWFSTLGCGALLKDGALAGIIVATPEGRGVVLASKVVDSTGNADIAAAAGAECTTTSAEHVAMQGTGLSPRALGTGYTNTDYSFSDESDPVDQARMIVSARRKFSTSYDISPFIDTRERQRIVGDASVSPLDIVNNRQYGDTIALHQSNFDSHGFTVHPFFLINAPDKKSMTAAMPYRALLPRGLENIIVTGLAISAHRDAMPILRMQPCIQNQGYAAGVAAAMASKGGMSFRSINIRKLQQHLVDTRCLPEDVLTADDSKPPTADDIAEAVRSVTTSYRGLAIVLDHPDAALPLLREAWKAANSPADKLVYANILGMLGDPTGAASLAETIDAADWDLGWNFRGMGQFGGSISPLDSHIIALGRSGDPRALPVILKKLAQLDHTKEFSHHRAVAMALEALRNPAAAKPLANLLSGENMTGYAVTEISPDSQPAGEEHRSQPLREIILARALFRCGDADGLGQRILESYTRDLHGLFARHAQAVLDEKRD